jgi:SAM-dependent methyltransferase
MAVDRMTRATSFGSVAEDYDRYRPAPPSQSADWLLPPGARRVADLCAGTGGFSRVLAPRVAQVIAIELDPRMAAVLAARSAGVQVVNARGEALPIGTGSLDAVVVSSGWHWLDPELAVPEIARVLRPGGVLGVVWNGPARQIEWVDELLSGNREAAAGRVRPGHVLSIPDGQPFSPPEGHTIEWTLPRSPSQLVGLAGTYSRVIVQGPEERQAVARRAAAVLERDPMLRDRARIELPMRARCWRAVRLPQR